jgi:beta-glucanase (GH16 family)
MYNPFARLLHLAALFVFAAAIAGCGGGGGADSPKTAPWYPEDPEDEWNLVWSDEFDGDRLDTGNWDIQTGDGTEEGIPGWGNNEQQYYTADNITVADGNLTITAKDDGMGGKPYTSARIRTAGKFDFTYGRIEARIQSAGGQGLWNAFWMLPTDSPYNGWAASGEIDIMEVINAGTSNEAVYGTLHHGFAWPLNQQSPNPNDTEFRAPEVPVSDPDRDFHVYALEWSGKELRWYVDGNHYQTITSDSWYSYYYGGQDKGYALGEGSAPLDVDFHLLLNLAVGGNLAGAVDDAAIPAEMVVDYVRVYSCTFDTEDGSGCNGFADRNLPTPGAQEPFIANFDLYDDSAGPLEWPDTTSTRDLALNSWPGVNNGFMFQELPADDPERGTIIDIWTSELGNLSIAPEDGNTSELFGMQAGELKFDLYIDSESTDQDSSILVKMDSGWPALGFKELKVADLPQDQWTTVSVRVAEFLENPGDEPLDLSSVVSLFVLEPTSSAHLQVDNVELNCGHPADLSGEDEATCGITPPKEFEGTPRVEGTWRLAPEAGALAVGPSKGSTEWWSNSDADVITRDCLFDDDYVFNADGSFRNVLGDETWLEPWQIGAEECGAPVAPHDGSSDASWTYDAGAGTLTIDGYGAYVGLAKANNDGELSSPDDAVSTITYEFVFESATEATVYIETGTGDGVFWTFKMVKVSEPPVEPELAGTWQLAPEAGALAVGPSAGSSEWWSNSDADVITRDCLFDDDYVFNTDGSFSNVLGDETWLEPWQSGTEECGAPVAPHDGSSDASWSYDAGAGTLTINGYGAYVGLAKANNDGELSSPDDAVSTIVYDITFDSPTEATVLIEAGAGVFWTFKLVKVAEPEAPAPIIGSWSLAPEAAALAVGPSAGSSEWWSNSDADVITRDCLFDDDYVFNADGSFQNVMDDETWLEPWQSGTEECGAPVAPHDGSSDASWSYNEVAGTVTINGYGAYIGLAKANNDGELSSPDDAVSTIVYDITFDSATEATVLIEAGSGVFWTFRLVKN